MGQNSKYDRLRLSGRLEDVTYQQEEQLVRLMEECGELTQVCSKILRWGWQSKNPNFPNGDTNAQAFHKEARDVGDMYDRISKTLR